MISDVGETSVNITCNYKAPVLGDRGSISSFIGRLFERRIMDTIEEEGWLIFMIAKEAISAEAIGPQDTDDLFQLKLKADEIRTLAYLKPSTLSALQASLLKLENQHAQLIQEISQEFSRSNIANPTTSYFETYGVDCFGALQSFDLGLNSLLDNTSLESRFGLRPINMQVTSLLSVIPKDGKAAAEDKVSVGMIEIESDTKAELPACRVMSISEGGSQLHINLLGLLMQKYSGFGEASIPDAG